MSRPGYETPQSTSVRRRARRSSWPTPDGNEFCVSNHVLPPRTEAVRLSRRTQPAWHRRGGSRSGSLLLNGTFDRSRLDRSRPIIAGPDAPATTRKTGGVRGQDVRERVADNGPITGGSGILEAPILAHWATGLAMSDFRVLERAAAGRLGHRIGAVPPASAVRDSMSDFRARMPRCREPLGRPRSAVPPIAAICSSDHLDRRPRGLLGTFKRIIEPAMVAGDGPWTVSERPGQSLSR